MSIFDGSPDELTYGQALVELAGRVSWPTETHGAEVVEAIEKEHGIGLDRAQAEVNAYDPRDADLAAKDAELVRLRTELAQRQKADAEAAKDAELAELRAQLAGEDDAAEDVAKPVKATAKAGR